MDIDTFCYSDCFIEKILAETQTIAVVGASSKPERDSYKVIESLLEHGYRVFPVNPNEEGSSVLGLNFYPNLSSIQQPIDMVDVFRASDAVFEIAEEAIKIKAKVLWMQLEIINNDAANLAEAAGMKVVMNRCPKKEFKNLNWTSNNN
ncbi:MAG: CoA-binding protein [Gammaproteobacteria bacterium]|tara:strand:+ start:554 stop:997 length:444 start_codon:yes stop_codon:yes gene_type:complete